MKLFHTNTVKYWKYRKSDEVIPYKYRNIFEMLFKLMVLCEITGSRQCLDGPAPASESHIIIITPRANDNNNKLIIIIIYL